MQHQLQQRRVAHLVGHVRASARLHDVANTVPSGEPTPRWRAGLRRPRPRIGGRLPVVTTAEQSGRHPPRCRLDLRRSRPRIGGATRCREHGSIRRADASLAGRPAPTTPAHRRSITRRHDGRAIRTAPASLPARHTSIAAAHRRGDTMSRARFHPESRRLAGGPAYADHAHASAGIKLRCDATNSAQQITHVELADRRRNVPRLCPVHCSDPDSRKSR